MATATFSAQMNCSGCSNACTKILQKIDGKGQDEPVADNNTNSGKAQNRRVVVTILK